MGIAFGVIAFVVGVFFALAELLSRYRDSPLGVFKTLPSLFYLFINGVFSFVAFYIYTQYFLDSSNAGEPLIMPALLCGTSGTLVFRSSLFKMKIGDEKTYDIGLSFIAETFLNVADRSFDRIRSEKLMKRVFDIIGSVDFDKAKKNLTTVCLELMDGIQDYESEKFGEAVSQLDNASDYCNKVKAVVLGAHLAKITGIELLEEAVSRLGDSIKIDESERISCSKSSGKAFDELNGTFQELMNKFRPIDGS